MNNAANSLSLKRQSKAFLLLSCLPLIGGLSFSAFYFLAYRNIAHDPINGMSLPAPGAGYGLIYSIANYVLLLMPINFVFWLVAILASRIRDLKIGRLGIVFFISGLVIYWIVTKLAPEYFYWFTY